MTQGVFDALKAANRLPSPPRVAIRVLELTRSPDSTPAEIAQVIGSDPSLSSRILKFVNSPPAGIPRKVSSLRQAITLIGLRGVKMIALSFSLMNSETGKGCARFDYESFWSRSLACAVASKAIAKTVGEKHIEEAFVAGLLSRIGQLALASGVPATYERVLNQAYDHPSELFDMERKLIGNTHLEISTQLLREWRLPDEIWQAIDGFRGLAEGRDGRDVGSLPRILYLADLVATLVCEAASGNAGILDETLRFARDEFQCSQDTWAELFRSIVGQWREYGQVLSVKTTDAKSFRELQDEARQEIAELSLATQLENQVVRAQNTELLHQASTDKLTGVANRSSFDERLVAELDHAKRTGRPLSLVLFDIDHFKSFNDGYGHQAGDKVLQCVAKTLDKAARKMDLIARYGGEEFAVIAPECDLNVALDLADRLRTAIQTMKVEWKGQSLRVTVSAGVGVAKWPERAKTAQQLIASADACLYQAKESGRNCCRAERSHALAGPVA